MRHPADQLATLAGWLSRKLGRGGGTTLPGAVVLRLRPRAIAALRDQLAEGALVVSGTNGKTTTARLITACARAGGLALVTNPSGANLATGVATALVDGPRRSPTPLLGLFEVDEAALPGVVEQLHPRVVVLMNLFRDQLDRYGELETLAERWRQMIATLPATTTVVLNADDPAVADLGDQHPNVLWFGIQDRTVALGELPHAADSSRCRRCGAPLDYDAVLLGHLGHWRCERCGWRRPTPSVSASRIVLHGLTSLDITIDTPKGAVTVEGLKLPGVHNAYNAVAATAAAVALGIDVGLVAPALQGSQAAFGRSERVSIQGRELVMLLVKNPTGANEIIRTLRLDPDPQDLLLFLNDRTADGRDVSWIWDVDYEQLLPRVRNLTLSGDRAHDLALRFRYGGLDADRVHVVDTTAAALDAALMALPEGRPLYALPTYTAMLDLRAELVARGVAQDFWHER